MKTITVDALKKLLDQDDVVLIDVREPAEYRSENIEKSHLIPLGKVSLDQIPSGKKIVVHCRSGGRSAEACRKLLKERPEMEIYSLEGGISAWQEAGYPVQSSGVKMIPIDRQVQIFAGFLISLGMLLGAFYDSDFYIIPAFIGLGLMFAGMTGFCGMAKLLAKMPWNQ